METSSERVTIDAGGAAMPAYVAAPTGGGPYPGVVVFMEIFGINEHIRSVVDRVAAEGYVAIAPDVFHRTAPGIELGYDEEGLARGMQLMTAAKASELMADTQATIDYLGSRADVGGKGVGVMGFCFGGHAAYLSACELPVAATASFYGGGIAQGAPGNETPVTVERTGGIKGRILCLFGEKDGYISAEEVATIKSALESQGVDHEVVVYPDVGHGFFCDARPDYDQASASDAWQKVKALFSATLS